MNENKYSSTYRIKKEKEDRKGGGFSGYGVGGVGGLVIGRGCPGEEERRRRRRRKKRRRRS
jgi:hypothetical protein